MVKQMLVNGERSVGVYTATADGAEIYAFKRWGKLYFCGNGETMRSTKAEAYQDARTVRRV